MNKIIHPNWTLVILESPYKGNVPLNINYLRACLRDCIINHHESPIASHGLLTQRGVLNDNNPLERKLGISAGIAWYKVSDGSRVYTDLGITKGMKKGIEYAKDLGKREGKEIIFRHLGKDWENEYNDFVKRFPNHPFTIHKVQM